MGKIIRFYSEHRKCPAGSLVKHPGLGLVRVEAVQGFQRTVVFPEYADDGRYSENLCDVDVRVLTEIPVPRVSACWLQW